MRFGVTGSLIAALLIGLLGPRARERNSVVGVLMPSGLGLGILFLALQTVGALLVLALLVTPAALRVAADPLGVSLLSMVFAVVSMLGGVLLALGAAIPISPYVTPISFAIYLVCRGIGRRRRRSRTADVGFPP